MQQELLLKRDELARAHRLGEVQKEYSFRYDKRQIAPMGVVLLSLFIFGVIYGLIALGFSWGLLVMVLVFIATFLLVGLIMGGVFYYYRNVYVCVYTGGLIYLFGNKERAVRWEQIRKVSLPYRSGSFQIEVKDESSFSIPNFNKALFATIQREVDIHRRSGQESEREEGFSTRCQYCNAELAAGTAFCGECGRPVAAGTAEVSTDNSGDQPTPPEAPPQTFVPSVPNMSTPKNDMAIVNQRQSTSMSRGNNTSRLLLSSSKPILLIGLAVLLLMVCGSGLFYVIHTNQITAANSRVTVTAVVNPYGGRLALYDPLRDNSLGNSWEEVSNKWGTCAFTQGAYYATQAANSGGNYCTALSADFGNFAFEVQMKTIKGGSGGLIFREDYNNNNFYAFILSENGYYAFLLCPSGYCNSIVTTTFSSAIHEGLNQTNIVAVVAKGSTFTLYVNHQQLISANDNTYTHGHIALAAWPARQSSDLTEVVYSNAKVWTF